MGEAVRFVASRGDCFATYTAIYGSGEADFLLCPILPVPYTSHDPPLPPQAFGDVVGSPKQKGF
jgi:hypothetical protein